MRNLKNRIKQTEKGGCIYKQKKNASIEQGPNEMGRMEIRIWSWVARFYKLEQNETQVGSSCGKEMMSRLFSNLETNSLTQPMNTFCTLDSMFFSWHYVNFFFPRGRNILWVNK